MAVGSTIPSDVDLGGAVALVTGASGGIGSAVACSLASAGAQLALTGRRADALEDVRRTIADAGGKASVFPFDLLSEPVDGLVRRVESELGSVEILVNNAGITRDTLAMRMSDDDWNQVVETNLTIPFRLTRACLKGMFKARKGRIIQIGSVVGAMGSAGQANYAAAKAGLVGLTKALAREVAARGITVNCVAPGFVKTAMTDQLTDDKKEGIVANIPLRRVAKPEEIAFAVLYFSSPLSGYVTGETLHINGGLNMV